YKPCGISRSRATVEPRETGSHESRQSDAGMSGQPAILVTGGAGYIGSHGCRALAAAGYQPVVFDNLSTGHRNFVTGPLVVGELVDRAALAAVFAQHRIVAVMHFAAASLV